MGFSCVDEGMEEIASNMEDLICGRCKRESCCIAHRHRSSIRDRLVSNARVRADEAFITASSVSSKCSPKASTKSCTSAANAFESSIRSAKSASSIST